MSKYAIIVAGGSGSRMKSDLPKQFLELNGFPILMHTIRAFESCEIVVVLPADQHEFWDELCKKHNFKIAHKVVAGGATRFQSVRNGLSKIPDTGLVAIHDGVRPLIDLSIIDKSFEVADKKGSAIVAVQLKDSIREVSGESNQARDRGRYQLIQTPQTFDIQLIKKAFEVEESNLFTDDASVLEHAGHSINLIEGSYRNIKITTPEDLKIAEALLN